MTSARCSRLFKTFMSTVFKQRFYPGQPLCWKAAAFAHEVNEIYEKLGSKTSSKGSSSRNQTSISFPEKDKDKDDCESMESTDVSSNSSMVSMDSMDEDGVCCRSDQNDQRQQSLMWTENREIISFGDSMEERTAVSIVSGQMDAVPKSIKLMGSPTLLQIIGQLHMLANHMQFVCESTESLDLHITVDQADTCAASYLKEHQIKYDENIVPNYLPRKGSSLSIANYQ